MDMRSFHVFIKYYTCFIPKYKQVAKLLYQLISGENFSKNKNKNMFVESCQEAFNKLKELCSTTQILAYADFSKPLSRMQMASGLVLFVPNESQCRQDD